MTRPAVSSRAFALATLLIMAGVFMRVARHYGWVELPPNVAPVGALALFAATYLPRRYAFAIPFTLMVLSDLLIGFDFWPVTVSIYACFAVNAGLGFWARRRWNRLAAAAVAGSVVFFLATNAAVWAFTGMYAAGLNGLWHSYVAGLPFFRNTLLGDLSYAVLLFGIYEAVVLYSRRRSVVRAAAVHD